MEDNRIWEFEQALWTGDASEYHEKVDEASVFVVPHPPYIMSGSEAIDALSKTPRWSQAQFSEQRVERPQEGLIVIAYHMLAKREEGADYEANCTTTMRRLSHEEWRVVQHQQTPPLTMKA